MTYRMEKEKRSARELISAKPKQLQFLYKSQDVIQVNLPAESGDMGVLANHVPSIEQLKPGLIEIIEESGSSKQFFRTFLYLSGLGIATALEWMRFEGGRLLKLTHGHFLQCPVDSPSSSPTRP